LTEVKCRARINNVAERSATIFIKCFTSKKQKLGIDKVEAEMIE